MEALQVGESGTSVPGDAGEIKLWVYLNIDLAVSFGTDGDKCIHTDSAQLNRLTDWDTIEFGLIGIMFLESCLLII